MVLAVLQRRRPHRLGAGAGQPTRFERLSDRVHQFATSLADPGPHTGRVVIGVTHSPVLRAVLTAGTGTDPGEPAYVTGALLRPDIDWSMKVTRFDPLSP